MPMNTVPIAITMMPSHLNREIGSFNMKSAKRLANI